MVIRPDDGHRVELSVPTESTRTAGGHRQTDIPLMMSTVFQLGSAKQPVGTACVHAMPVAVLVERNGRRCGLGPIRRVSGCKIPPGQGSADSQADHKGPDSSHFPGLSASSSLQPYFRTGLWSVKQALLGSWLKSHEHLSTVDPKLERQEEPRVICFGGLYICRVPRNLLSRP